MVFTCLQYKSFEKNLGKGEIARYEQFLLFPQCFVPIWRTLCNLKLSPANSFNLTHSHTMTPFDAPGKQAF